MRINVRIDHTMRDGNAPEAVQRLILVEPKRVFSLMHESAIYVSPDVPWLWGRCSRGAALRARAQTTLLGLGKRCGVRAVRNG